jgi:hypothetical protein
MFLRNVRSVYVTPYKHKLTKYPYIPCLGRHVKPLVLAAFAVVSTHQPALGPRGGLWPVLLLCNL